VSRYEKGEANLDFTEARDSEWQWHQLGHMQVWTSLQADNHTSTPPLNFYRPNALPATEPTASKHELFVLRCLFELCMYDRELRLLLPVQETAFGYCN